MNDKVYIPCECHTEGVVVSYDDETETFDLSFVATNKHSLVMPFVERLKLCWHVLRTGTIYNDQVIMSKSSAGLLANHLVNKGAHTYNTNTYTVDEINRTKSI